MAIGGIIGSAGVSGGVNADAPVFEMQSSRQFPAWLYEQKISLVFTSYQTGKLFLIGLQPNGRLGVFERTLDRCMGLAVNRGTLFVSTLYQLIRFENILGEGEIHEDHDALYVPRVGHYTGDLDIHDIGVDKKGNVIFANTLFNCLSTVSKTHSFKPLWRPKFISKLAAEDRCHLNGLAMENGVPKYVTCVSETDVAEGWREHRKDGGVLIDVKSKKVVCRGLSMPHSPRVHNGKVYLLNAGTGYFGYVDMKKGVFVPMTFCPGFLRGLSIVGDFAIVGTSKMRESNLMEGTAFKDNLAKEKVEAKCSLQVIDLKTGDKVHWLQMDGIVQEIYDVAVLEGIHRPMAIGFRTDEIRRMINIDEGK